jgi:hypothetical protein
VRQRSRCGTITITRQTATQRFNRASMLKQQRGGDGRVSRVCVEERAVLGRGQENFRRMLAGIIEKASPSRVGEAAMLELDNEMRAPVRQAAAL